LGQIIATETITVELIEANENPPSSSSGLLDSFDAMAGIEDPGSSSDYRIVIFAAPPQNCITVVLNLPIFNSLSRYAAAS
jgi:hypothetical protein